MARSPKNPFFVRLVARCCRYAGIVTAVAILLGIAGLAYSATHFQMNSDAAALISPDLSWRERGAAFDKLFPQQDRITLVVIDGATPERAEEAASALAAKLAKDKAHFISVTRPDGGPFFARNGLLFLPLADVQSTTAQMIKAQPFLGALAADPSLRGVFGALSTALDGVAHGQAKLSDLDGPMVAFTATLSQIEAGKTAFFSWGELLGAKSARAQHRFVLIKPKLDYGSLEPGGAASNAIRQTAQALHLTPDNGVRVRLTGEIPLNDEQFASLSHNAALIGALMLAAVLLTLWLVLRSGKLMLAVLVSLLVGLGITAAFGLIVTGAFNLISVAFIPLFVGLGVDFGIQFCVRYRAERHDRGELGPSLVAAGERVGTPLALAALAIAAGFLAFVPTDYVGVAELGEIAGFGMLIAFALSVTALPAMITLLNPGGEAAEIGYPPLAPVDRFLQMNRRGVLLTMLALALISLALIPRLHFDFNPLDIEDPHAESVSTLFELMQQPENSPNTIDVVEPSLQAANAMRKKLGALPQVAEVLWLESFIPAQQTQKLAAINDASMLLGPTLQPFLTKPAPGDAEVVAALNDTAGKLDSVAGNDASRAAADARHLAAALTKLAQAPSALRAKAQEAFVPGLKTMLRQVRDVLSARPVTLANLPADLKRQWLAPDGQTRVKVIPSGNQNDSETIRSFTKAVLRAAPTASGAAISIQKSGDTIVNAFIEAGIGSFIIVTILLAFALRRASDVALAVLSLLLTGMLTMASAVAVRMQINFANIIALPLLFGIGVAFNIYYLVAWRRGIGNLLQSSLARAIVFSALTTASGFGMLWLSDHPGTASMGELLMISLGWTVVTALLFLPALLGPPRQQRE